MKSREGFKMVECGPIIRDAIEMDPSGFYFLIRINFRNGYIECAACHPDVRNEAFLYEAEPGEKSQTYHLKEIFYGRCAQDIYHRILEDTKYVTSMTHSAYLGKELKKAEIALALGIPSYYQE